MTPVSDGFGFHWLLAHASGLAIMYSASSYRMLAWWDLDSEDLCRLLFWFFTELFSWLKINYNLVRLLITNALIGMINWAILKVNIWYLWLAILFRILPVLYVLLLLLSMRRWVGLIKEFCRLCCQWQEFIVRWFSILDSMKLFPFRKVLAWYLW